MPFICLQGLEDSPVPVICSFAAIYDSVYMNIYLTLFSASGDHVPEHVNKSILSVIERPMHRTTRHTIS